MQSNGTSYDALRKNIINVAQPTEHHHAATRQYVNEVFAITETFRKQSDNDIIQYKGKRDTFLCEHDGTLVSILITIESGSLVFGAVDDHNLNPIIRVTAGTASNFRLHEPAEPIQPGVSGRNSILLRSLNIPLTRNERIRLEFLNANNVGARANAHIQYHIHDIVGEELNYSRI